MMLLVVLSPITKNPKLMKIRINILLTSLIVFFISSTSHAQTDTTRAGRFTI